MSVNTRSSGERTDVNMPVIIFVVVLCIGITVAASYKTLTPTHGGQVVATSSNDAFMANIARQAGPEADLTKVNPVDRAAFLRQVPNDAQRMLKAWIAQHKH